MPQKYKKELQNQRHQRARVTQERPEKQLLKIPNPKHQTLKRVNPSDQQQKQRKGQKGLGQKKHPKLKSRKMQKELKKINV